MEPDPTGTTDLVNKQIAIIQHLQISIIESLDRNDSSTAQRLIESCDRAFRTFIAGTKAMAIDVSNLKNVLKNSGGSTDVIQQLSDRVAQLEQKIGAIDATAIAALQSDVSDIKSALEDLNSSAPTTPA